MKTSEPKNWWSSRKKQLDILPDYGNLPHEVRRVIYSIFRSVYKHSFRMVMPSELLQEGIIAATKLMPEYDPEKSSHSSFFSKRVRGAMIDFVRYRHPFGLGAARRQGREKRAGLPRSVPFAVPLPRLEGQEDDEFDERKCRALSSYDPEPSDGPAREFRAALKKMLPWLDDREKELLVGYFVYGRTLREVGELMGRSEARMSMMLKAVLQRAREEGARAGTLLTA